MNNTHRSKLSYYKQMYAFGSLIAQIAHPSWLEEIPVPSKIAHDKTKLLAFQSQFLFQNSPDLNLNNNIEHGILVFIASLPVAKFNRFLRYLILAFLKNDHSLLINGIKLKKLHEFFSAEEMEFLMHEKEVKIKIQDKFSLDKTKEFELNLIFDLGFYILKPFYKNTIPGLMERFQFRFPKIIVENEYPHFNFKIDTNLNWTCVSIIAQALFPEIYSVFEADFAVKEEQNKINDKNINSLANMENAYKIPTVHEP